MGSLRDDRIQSLYLSLETAQHPEISGGMGGSMQHACVTLGRDLHL